MTPAKEWESNSLQSFIRFDAANGRMVQLHLPNDQLTKKR
jgi:hypothetical protein